MRKQRILFVIIWSALSLIGVLQWWNPPTYYISYFLFGFHFVGNSVFIADVLVVIYERMDIALFIYATLLVFLIFWIIALARIKKSTLFERMIFVDRILTLGLWGCLFAVARDDFASLPFFIGLLIENMLLLTIYVICKIKKKSTTQPILNTH